VGKGNDSHKSRGGTGKTGSEAGSGEKVGEGGADHGR
jgi:hypothetical protein